MDIERPEELARFRGREQMLQQGLAERARLFGLPAPSMDKVARWVTAAAKQRSRLPQPEKLIPRAPLGVPPRPYKPIALGTTREGLKHIRQRVKARRGDTAPGPGGRKAIIARPLPIAALLAMSRRYEIKPPNKILDHEFVASKPGLYRAELTMERKGGWATLRWSVEKPQLVLRVQGQRRHVLELVYNRLSPAQKSMAKVEVAGYAPIIRCNKLLNTGLHMGRVHYLYFWVKPSDIPLSRRLRIRFEVLQNVNAKPFKDPAGIDQDPLAGVPRDPVVRGMVRVAYQPPTPIAYGKPKKIPFLNKKDPKKSSFPLAVVEAPLYTRSPKKGHSAYKLNVKLSPHPNRFVPNEMKWVKDAKGKWALKRLPHNVGILWGQVQVVADHTPVPSDWALMGSALSLSTISVACRSGRISLSNRVAVNVRWGPSAMTGATPTSIHTQASQTKPAVTPLFFRVIILPFPELTSVIPSRHDLSRCASVPGNDANHHLVPQSTLLADATILPTNRARRFALLGLRRLQ